MLTSIEVKTEAVNFWATIAKIGLPLVVPTSGRTAITIYFQACCLIHVYTDGSVLLSHGGIEMGQGLHTKMIQIASRVLVRVCFQHILLFLIQW